jgi:hypothetical protein
MEEFHEFSSSTAVSGEGIEKSSWALGMNLLDGEQYGEELLPPSGSLEVFIKAMKAYEPVL